MENEWGNYRPEIAEKHKKEKSKKIIMWASIATIACLATAGITIYQHTENKRMAIEKQKTEERNRALMIKALGEARKYNEEHKIAVKKIKKNQVFDKLEAKHHRHQNKENREWAYYVGNYKAMDSESQFKKSLDDCIKKGEPIDKDVVHCMREEKE